MREILTTGSTTLPDGVIVQNMFRFVVDDDAVDILLSNECKVRTRAGHSKAISASKSGETITVHFYRDGDKVRARVIDEAAERRAALQRKLEVKAKELGKSVEELLTELLGS